MAFKIPKKPPAALFIKPKATKLTTFSSSFPKIFMAITTKINVMINERIPIYFWFISKCSFKKLTVR